MVFDTGKVLTGCISLKMRGVVWEMESDIRNGVRGGRNWANRETVLPGIWQNCGRNWKLLQLVEEEGSQAVSCSLRLYAVSHVAFVAFAPCRVRCAPGTSRAAWSWESDRCDRISSLVVAHLWDHSALSTGLGNRAKM